MPNGEVNINMQTKTSTIKTVSISILDEEDSVLVYSSVELHE